MTSALDVTTGPSFDTGSTTAMTDTGAVDGDPGGRPCEPPEVACAHDGSCVDRRDDCCVGAEPGLERAAEGAACGTEARHHIHPGRDAELSFEPVAVCQPQIACPEVLVCDRADPGSFWLLGDCGVLPDGFFPCEFPQGLDPYRVQPCPR